MTTGQAPSACNVQPLVMTPPHNANERPGPRCYGRLGELGADRVLECISVSLRLGYSCTYEPERYMIPPRLSRGPGIHLISSQTRLLSSSSPSRMPPQRCFRARVVVSARRGERTLERPASR